MTSGIHESVHEPIHEPIHLEADAPAARDSLRQALQLQETDPAEAVAWLRRVVERDDDFAAWKGAASLLDRLEPAARTLARREVRLGVVGSYTTDQLVELVKLAAFRFGVWVDVYEAGFDQYQQEVLSPDSGLYRFDPEVVLFAVHTGALDIPDHADDPESVVAAEIERWSGLWRHVRDRTGATVIQHNFVVPAEDAHGHLASALPGSHRAMVRAVALGLAGTGEPGVALVDCDTIAGRLGKAVWFDDRYWFLAKQAVALGALPALARHTGAVLAAQLGLAHKALVLDLDNTLWGGTIGDDGLDGIRLGQGSPEGEAFVAFQRYCKALADRGVVLAVCSKNDDATARLPFREHPDMVLAEDDVAAFVANWEPKPGNVRRIAEMLDIGLDALVFVDDNPAEREVVRRYVPSVEVVTMPADPAGYVSAVAESLLFETTRLTDEDRQRTRQYRARAAAAELREQATSIEDFHRDLEMRAVVAPVDDVNLPRVAQLIGKTNQFNLTTRRHREDEIRRMMADPDFITFYIRLRDRLADHGLIAVVIGRVDGDTLEVDTWAMSCRVIGRTVERTVLTRLVAEAQARGLETIRGVYIPTERNGLVARLYADLGFEAEGTAGDSESWTLRVPEDPVHNDFIGEEPPT